MNVKQPHGRFLKSTLNLTDSQSQKNIENTIERNLRHQKKVFIEETEKKIKKDKQRLRSEQNEDLLNIDESEEPVEEELMEKAEHIEKIDPINNRTHTAKVVDMLKREQEKDVIVLSDKKEFKMKDKKMKKRAEAEEVRKTKEKEKEKEEETKEIGMKSDWIVEVEDVEFENLEEELRKKEALAAAEEELRRKRYYETQLEKRRQNDESLRQIQQNKVSHWEPSAYCF